MDLNQLQSLVHQTQDRFRANVIDLQNVSTITNALAAGGFSYDRVKFPTLVDTENFTDTAGDSPSSLAEALLWKLGKWKSYVKFSEQYHDLTTQPTNSDTVFFAFARHLQDNSNLIYDQHALRALWAIDDTLNDFEVEKIKSVLINGKNEWKQTGAGSHATDCYEIFTNHANSIISKGIDARTLDDLLMPLGQALKNVSADYPQFAFACGWTLNSEAG